MQTISINFILPENRQDISDKHLRYIYDLIGLDFNTDEVKTLFLHRWSGAKIVGKQDNGSYLPNSLFPLGMMS